VEVFGYADRNSTAGRKLARLLGDEKPHRLTVEVGAPQRRMPLDGMVEIIQVWEWAAP
jgi:hypothetical protein